MIFYIAFFVFNIIYWYGIKYKKKGGETMNINLLIFFAIPLAIIIFSIALEKIFRNPFLVAGIIFSILLIIVLAFFDLIYLVAVLVYTILSFVTALLTCIICRNLNNNSICNVMCNCNNGGNNTDIMTIPNNEINTLNNEVNNNFSAVTGCYSKNYNRRR